jgi:hypothetical protein
VALNMPYFKAKGLGAVIWNSGALMTQIQWFHDLKPFLCNTTKGQSKNFNIFFCLTFTGDDVR